jgi:hypothetical protein
MSTDRLRRGHEVTFGWRVEATGTYPSLDIEFERGDIRLPAVSVLIDTGADVSVLPRTWIPMLGLLEKDLRTAATTGIGGVIRALSAVDAGIVAAFGIWRIALPRVDFIANAPLILGRDALFGSLELRMNGFEIGLRSVERVSPA